MRPTQWRRSTHVGVGVAVLLLVAAVVAVAAVLTSSATPDAIVAMLADCGARHLFLDAPMAARLGGAATGDVKRIAFDGRSR